MTQEQLYIDGRTGEGGGQVLRTSLALSMITGIPVRFEHIRAGRKKPGLMRQHLTCVRAAAAVCGATVQGDEVRSTELEFVPGAIQAGDYEFAIGTAGSTTLVLQTVLPALMVQEEPSLVSVMGGTHNAKAPSFDFLARVFAPMLARFGPRLDVKLVRAGFYPAGGGRIEARITPVALDKLTSMALHERGSFVHRSVHAAVSNLPKHIAKREVNVMSDMLTWPRENLEVVALDSPGPGNVAWIQLEYAEVTEMFVSYGAKGKHAELVAKEAVEQARDYMATSAPVGKHLADQLMIPMALAGSGSFKCTAPSRHTLTQIEIIEKFLEVEFVVERRKEERMWEIRVTS